MHGTVRPRVGQEAKADDEGAEGRCPEERKGDHGSVDESEPKVSEWKGPYHNMRMCLEMARRLGGK